MDCIEAIGFAASASGLRPNKDKVEVMRNYPSPTNEELERFIYLTIYLRQCILGRAELIRIMKLAILTEINWTEREEQLEMINRYQQNSRNERH
jgi:predicted transcriptional regulator